MKHEEPVVTRELGISGMTCDHGVRRVQKALRSDPGVRGVSVNRATGSAEITYDSTQTDLRQLEDRVLNSGYTPISTEA